MRMVLNRGVICCVRVQLLLCLFNVKYNMMKIQLNARVWAMFALSFVFASCSKDDAIPLTTLTVKLEVPSDYVGFKSEEVWVKVRNMVSNRSDSVKADALGNAVLVVEQGTYQIAANTKQLVSTTVSDGGGTKSFSQEVSLVGLIENQILVGDISAVSVKLTPVSLSSGFVIKEVYFAGCTTPLNAKYWKDQYIEIYNNSDKVLYADGLSIAEVSHTTSLETDDWAKFNIGGVVVGTVYTIPGAGTSYPVQPGKSIVIANVAIDHTVEIPSSVNLTKANWEWYDDNKLDVDVPEVPNLIKNFSYSATVWIMHTRGYRGYLIFQEPNMARFLETYKVTRPNASGSGTVSAISVPYASIIDAVELSNPAAFMLKAMPASVDASFTYVTAANSGKCVRRKVDRVVDGRVVYQDTNNSAVDFMPNQAPAPGKN